MDIVFFNFIVIIIHKFIDFNINKIKNVTLKLEGYPAIVFQHEYDHLDGILFTDKLFKTEELDPNIFPLFEESEE